MFVHVFSSISSVTKNNVPAADNDVPNVKNDDVNNDDYADDNNKLMTSTNVN